VPDDESALRAAMSLATFLRAHVEEVALHELAEAVRAEPKVETFLLALRSARPEMAPRAGDGSGARSGALEMATSASRAAEAELEAFFESAPIGAALLDPALRYVRVNPCLARLNGLPIGDHVGKTPRDILPSAIAERIEAPLQLALARRTDAAGIELDEPPAPPEGRPVDLDGAPTLARSWLASFFPVLDRGDLLGVGAVVTDITAQKAQEAKLVEAGRFRERIIGVLGHDLRNPLSAVIMATGALASSSLDPKQQRIVELLDRTAHRMMAMIEDLLDFTRARSSGGLPIAPRLADLHDVVRRAIEELRVARPDCKLLVVGAGDLCCCCDQERMAAVVSNLVSNAIEHGDRAREITIDLDGRGPSTIAVRVHNYGDPIAPALLPRIFEPFTRSEKSVSSGLGLGLFIVDQIVRAHGGVVWVESNEARGTTFGFELSRAPDATLIETKRTVEVD